MLQLRSPSNQVKVARFAATGATVAKTPFVQNSRVFIPMNDADAATDGEHVYVSVVSDAPKAAAEAWAVGAPIYWNNTNGNFTTTSTGAVLCGHAIATAEAADTVTPLFQFNSFAA